MLVDDDFERIVAVVGIVVLVVCHAVNMDRFGNVALKSNSCSVGVHFDCHNNHNYEK